MMVNHLWFWIGLCFIMVHELDAIRCKEWRIFPGLSSLGDGFGSKIFIIAHIPLFILLFFGLRSSVVHSYLVVGLDFFFIIHVFLHLVMTTRTYGLLRTYGRSPRDRTALRHSRPVHHLDLRAGLLTAKAKYEMRSLDTFNKEHQRTFDNM